MEHLVTLRDTNNGGYEFRVSKLRSRFRMFDQDSNTSDSNLSMQVTLKPHNMTR